MVVFGGLDAWFWLGEVDDGDWVTVAVMDAHWGKPVASSRRRRVADSDDARRRPVLAGERESERASIIERGTWSRVSGSQTRFRPLLNLISLFPFFLLLN